MSLANAYARRIRWHTLRPCKSFPIVLPEPFDLCAMYFSVSHTHRHCDSGHRLHWKAILKTTACEFTVKRPATALSISDVGPSRRLTSARLAWSTLLASLSTLYFTLLQLLIDDLAQPSPWLRKIRLRVRTFMQLRIAWYQVSQQQNCPPK